MTGNETYLGQAMALGAAVVWSIAVILFKKSGEAVHPIGLNFFKGVMSAVLLIPTIWFFGETLFRDVPASDYWMLFASGALGIGIADTLFFMGLNSLGAGRSAIVDCLYSPSIISLSIIFLGESLTSWQIVGTTLIVSAVLAILFDKPSEATDRRKVLLGVLWGSLAMITMAVGIIMIKPLLNESPLLWATEIRLFGGLAILVLVWLVHPARRAIAASILAPQRWAYTWSGSFLGAYLSMILWLGGMKYTQASTAAALNQTSNIFIFIFAALILKERITLVRLIAIVLGVIGACLVTFG